jgi:hypothetical protein
MNPSDSTLTRRRLLQVGGIGMLGLGLPEVLWARAPGKALADKPKSCIFIVQGGGPSQVDTWDPKPDAPEGYRGPYKPIATRVPGLRICELMPRLATLTDRCCVIRSMTHRNGDHGSAMHAFLAGHSKPPADAPYFGSMVAKLRGTSRNVPSYVWLQDLEGDSGVGPRYQTGGFLGPAYAPFRVGNGMDNPSAPSFRVKALDMPRDIPLGRVDGRRRLLGALDPDQGPRVQPSSGAALGRLRERAFELLTGPETRQAFDIEREPTRVRDHYGLHPLGQNLLLSRRLIEAGVPIVSVTAFTGKSPGANYGGQGFVVNMWDMHGNGSSIFGNEWNGLGWALPRFDQAVAALLEDLGQRGLLESTLVVALGEMGRTPRINKGPKGPGRDHWPNCYTAMLAGGGGRGGRVYGASDKVGGYPRDNPVTPESFGATVLHALGIAPESRLGLDGFTRPASAGEPILDLFG